MRGLGLILAFLMAWASGLAQTPALDSLPNCTPVPGYRHRPTEDYYARAYDTIQAMVDGQKPLDFQKAVFLTEWAYLDGRMNPALFSAAIDRAAHFCQLLARQHGADTAKNPQLYYNWAAYNWVSDTVRVVVEGDTVERMPYRYDFDDYEGRAEWANTFVSKLLATGSGTCRSMPYLYKMLCDKLGAKSWLALAPQHVYVKHTNGDPNYPVLYNVETTSGSFPTDGWIMASSYVTLEGILSSIYMDSLTQQEAVALTLVDLAKGWQRRFGDRGPVDEEHFALKCAEACLAAHPENPNARLLRAELLRRRWARTGLERDSLAMAEAHVALAADGYREMPAEMYRDWVEGVRTNGGELLRRDVSRPFDPQKEFGNSGGSPVITLSDGRFREFYESDTVVRVGRVLIDVRSGLVVGFVDRDTLTSEATLEPEITSRWLSTDPLAGKFPYISPYAAFENNPILLVDPDGESPISAFAKRVAQLSLKKAAKEAVEVMVKRRLANYMSEKWAKQLFDDAMTAVDLATSESWASVAFGFVPIAGDLWGAYKLGEQGYAAYRVVQKFESIIELSSKAAGQAWKALGPNKVFGKGADVLQGYIKKFNNQGQDLAEDDVAGAVKEIFGLNSGVKKNGVPFKHLEKVENSLKGMKSQILSLEQAIYKGEFQGDALKAAQGVLRATKEQHSQISNTLNSARKAAQQHGN